MSGQVRSVIRAMKILRYLSYSNSTNTLSEISNGVELPASTTHRLLTTLESEKFVKFDNDLSEWQIGVVAFSVGSRFARARDLISFSRKYLQHLSSFSGETSNIYIESAGLIVCVAQIESKHNMRAITQVGGNINVHCSAAGKAIMAYRAKAEVELILSKHGMKKFTKYTIVEHKDFFDALKIIARNGYSIDLEENLEGLCCVSAPIFNENSRAVSAISVSGPSIRFSGKKLIKVSEELLSVSAEITSDYGGNPPHNWPNKIDD